MTVTMRPNDVIVSQAAQKALTAVTTSSAAAQGQQLPSATGDQSTSDKDTYPTASVFASAGGPLPPIAVFTRQSPRLQGRSIPNMNQLALESQQQANARLAQERQEQQRRQTDAQPMDIDEPSAQDQQASADLARDALDLDDPQLGRFTPHDPPLRPTHLRRISGTEFEVVRPNSAPAVVEDSQAQDEHPFPPPTDQEIDFAMSPASFLLQGETLDVTAEEEEQLIPASPGDLVIDEPIEDNTPTASTDASPPADDADDDAPAGPTTRDGQ
jgi:hypothetical protein